MKEILAFRFFVVTLLKTASKVSEYIDWMTETISENTAATEPSITPPSGGLPKVKIIAGSIAGVVGIAAIIVTIVLCCKQKTVPNPNENFDENIYENVDNISGIYEIVPERNDEIPGIYETVS